MNGAGAVHGRFRRRALSDSVWPTAPLVVGHRGGRGPGWARENTIAAFAQAKDQGASAIEIDVRTHEGQVIVLHDPPARPLAQLRPQVPTLREALVWAAAHAMAVNVEMKSDEVERVALARATARIVLASAADVLLSSFDPSLLAMVAALAPRIPRALLVHSRQKRWADAVQRAVRPPFVAALHVERTQAEPRLLSDCVARGLRVGVWTVNDPEEARMLVAHGASTLITDAPGAIVQALGRAAS